MVVYFLPGLSIDRSKLSDILVRLALLEDTQASGAVRQAILALVACHRGDTLTDAQKYQRAALHYLRSDTVSTTLQGLQHVVANMLLSVLGVCDHLVIERTSPDIFSLAAANVP